MLKINNKDGSEELAKQGKADIADEQENQKNRENKPEKIETCYFCLQKFDINKDDLSHYKYGKFPICDYCSQFYGFYDE